MADEFHFSTIAQTAELLRSRKVSPVELAQTYLKRISELDPQLNAFITVTADLALAQAREAEQEIAKGRYRGPLHGIPFGLKDIYNTRGILTSGGIPGSARTTFRPRTRRPRSKLREAGAVLLGKLADARVRARRPFLRPAVAAGAQSLAPRAFHRRLLAAAPARRVAAGLAPSRSAPTPAARSAGRRRTAGSRASCRPTGW